MSSSLFWAFGLIVAEDALDRYLVKWAEQRINIRIWRIVFRLAANSGRALANSASGRAPRGIATTARSTGADRAH
jgi:hypothetical protein